MALACRFVFWEPCLVVAQESMPLLSELAWHIHLFVLCVMRQACRLWGLTGKQEEVLAEQHTCTVQGTRRWSGCIGAIGSEFIGVKLGS